MSSDTPAPPDLDAVAGDLIAFLAGFRASVGILPDGNQALDRVARSVWAPGFSYRDRLDARPQWLLLCAMRYRDQLAGAFGRMPPDREVRAAVADFRARTGARAPADVDARRILEWAGSMLAAGLAPAAVVKNLDWLATVADAAMTFLDRAGRPYLDRDDNPVDRVAPDLADLLERAGGPARDGRGDAGGGN